MARTQGKAEIRAAGGVLWRRAGKRVEVLLVHRDRYDDWTFPKGKLDDGESWRKAAIREVAEETGLDADVGRELTETRYIDQKGRDKRVRYWAMTVADGEFEPNDEVDRVAWVKPKKARAMLTYDRDEKVLDSLLALFDDSRN